MKDTKLSEIAFEFLKIGLFSFGGPAAHIAMMERQLVERKNWISREEFLDMIGATNLIPGPNSTELAIHIGYRVRGYAGLAVAGISFILPAFSIVWFLAWFYKTYGLLPAFQIVFQGVTPVILAVIVQAVWGLGRTAVKDFLLLAIAVFALGAYFFVKNELGVLFIAAVVNVLIRRKSISSIFKIWIFALGLVTSIRAWAQEIVSCVPSNHEIFLVFAKIGSILFGSGYVLVAFLQSDLVAKYQWITQQQLVDAIAIGQVTPGPVFTTATFVGYLVAGNLGAVSATVGIFLPAFIFVAISAPFISRMRKFPNLGTLLDGLNVASLGLMAGSAVLLGYASIVNFYGVMVFLISLFLLIHFKMNSMWLIFVAGVLSFLS